MKRIMILCKQEETNVISERILQKERGCFISETVDLQEAWKQIIRIDVNLFVIDLTIYNSNSTVHIMHFIEQLRLLDKYAFVPIIFITNNWDFDLYLFQHLHCHSIVTKPLQLEELDEQLQNALKYSIQDNKRIHHLLLKKDHTIYKIELNEIVSIHHSRSNLEILTTDGKKQFPYQTTQCTLQNLDQQFITCKRGYVVNSSYIKEYKYKEGLLYMEYSKQPIAVSHKYHADILGALNS